MKEEKMISFPPRAKAELLCHRFFELVEVAASDRGFWVSAAGGTANVVAGVVSRTASISFEEAYQVLDEVGTKSFGEDWYSELASMQPWPATHVPDEDDAPIWDAGVIACAAAQDLTFDHGEPSTETQEDIDRLLELFRSSVKEQQEQEMAGMEL